MIGKFFIFRQFWFLNTLVNFKDTQYPADHILEILWQDDDWFKRRKYSIIVLTIKLIPRVTPFTWTLSNACRDLQWSKTSRLEFTVLDGANQPNLEIFQSKTEQEQTYLTLRNYECEWKLSKPKTRSYKLLGVAELRRCSSTTSLIHKRCDLKLKQISSLFWNPLFKTGLNYIYTSLVCLSVCPFVSKNV